MNQGKLLSFGFKKHENGYIYCCALAGGMMKMTVTVSEDGQIHTEVTDNISGDEYVLHRVPDASGSFVGQIKSEHDAVLDKIAANCFDREVFKSTQAKKVIAYIQSTYADEFEYLWEKFPNNAIVRRKDNRKWYAVILTVSRRKLGFDSDEPAEILDLRINPDELSEVADGKKYLPGYHMNKKHWITVCLDGTVELYEIFRRIDDSYKLAK